MGSTPGRYDVPTIKPASTLLHKGLFTQAKRELMSLNLIHPPIEAPVMLAICDYRLGDDQAFIRLRRNHGPRLTAEHNALLRRHEILRLIQRRKFTQAVQLLEVSDISDTSQKELGFINQAIDQIRLASKAGAKIDFKSGRFTAPRASRSEHLAKAECYCDQVDRLTIVNSDESSDLVMVINDYLTLIIELMQGQARDRGQERMRRKALKNVDEEFRKSLPRLSHLVPYIPNI